MLHQRGPAPSPLALAKIVTLFGDRPEPTREGARFPSGGCRDMAHARGDENRRARAEILNLGLAQIAFLAARRWKLGTRLAIELHHIALGWEW